VVADVLGNGVPDWLTDLLLESIAPPSNWLPSRAERLADARQTLRRRFGAARELGARPSHHLRDFGSAHPLFGGSRVVSGDEIEAAMEVEITTVNPPSAQGWIVITGAIVFVVELFMVKGLVTTPRTGVDAVASAAIGPLVWLAAIAALGWFERSIELNESGVRVRRWTDRWLGRAGFAVGPPEGLVARLDDPVSLILRSSGGSIRVSLRLWPHTARQDLVDELPIWGVDCSFDRHRHRPDRPGRRGRR
jgi:hypothetical protein